MTDTLEKLNDRLRAWKGIELAKTAHPVPGWGNPHADIMFIGEAPGAQEDKQQKPFVGPAGKMLDALLASIHLKREDVYITNIVKFRPPENRDPTSEEKAACLPFLQMEIAIIKPKVIVPLGRHALTQFCTKMSITEAHGKPQVLPGDISVFPLYHPAAALHNPNLKETLFADIKALKEFLHTRQSSHLVSHNS